MAKRKSTAEELLDLITEICFYLPVWAILLIPIVCGGGSYLAIDYLIQNKLQTMFAGEIGRTITVSLSLFVFALTALAALKGFLGRKQRKALLAQTQSTSEEPTNTATAPCPKCDSDLVERTAKRGPDAGNTFLGCSNSPKCRYTA
jgi:hypothetical protein